MAKRKATNPPEKDISNGDNKKKAISTGNFLPQVTQKGLSKKLSGMKFMRRTEEKKSLEEDENENKKQIAEAHWVVKYSTLPIEKPKIKVKYDLAYSSWGNSAIKSVGKRETYGLIKEPSKVNKEDNENSLKDKIIE